MNKPLLFLFFLTFKLFFSQLDNTHYLQPIIFGIYNANTITEEYIYLSTPTITNITVNVRMADGVTIPRLSVYNINAATSTIVTNGTVTFSNTTPVRLSIVNASNTVLTPGTSPITIATTRAGTIIPANIGGLIFQSTDEFFVNYRGQSDSQAGSALTKGKIALGKTFFWGGTPTELTTTVTEVGNMVSIMATENNTVVTISNIKAGTEFINGTNSTPITGTSLTRTLQKGQSFVLYAKVKSGVLSMQDKGWLGAKITSDKNIAVTVGGLMQQGDIDTGTTTPNRDFAVDQLVPVEQLGNEYVVMQGNGGAYEKVIVIATEANTTVSLNGNTGVNYTLASAGNYATIPATFFTNKNMYIKTNKSVYVFHKIYGAAALNTNSFMFIPPLSCFGQSSVNMIPDAKQIGDTVYGNTELAVLAAAGAANEPVVTLNGSVVVSPITGGSNIAVPGNPNWRSYRYNIAAATGRNLRISSAGTIQAELIGASGAAGFGGYYSGFGTAPIVTIDVGSSPTTTRPCTGTTGTSSLALSTTPGLGAYQWYKNGAAISGATNSTYTIPLTDATPAEYNVIVTPPGGCLIYSNVVKSYACPCYKPGATGTPEITKIGISTRAEKSAANWPADVNNAFLALESNDKGLVITRIPDPETSITEPVDGMIVFDTDEVCLKIYDGTQWTRINQTCN
ncbi:IgGFc-binding protein [Chryseobacterium oryctis]|uniref:IgGFc-binding protein n=1 Tax=Chryseobacterium oryctis TaxID=2952618 RepID=A0ABT3HP38_9FLAO|nr:IgGFc-binding protein [Chryseobacterium oryctis]MCW3161513.1 IgGFc-binding protein [Chryseobacterium oryctis]